MEDLIMATTVMWQSSTIKKFAHNIIRVDDRPYDERFGGKGVS